jgi:tRNA pseudouridine32 synthase/23S rRNA pseudouridine746 synthase
MQTRPSRLYLPKIDPAPETILEYILARFPQIDASVWQARIGHGQVTVSDGTRVRCDTPYRHGLTVFYRKEVEAEPPVTLRPSIVYCDDNLLVVDKPHGMPVTPSGDHVDRSALVHLQKTTGLADLCPIHRLDRETAGLLILSVKPETRAAYHTLFFERRVEREYIAASFTRGPLLQTRWRIEQRLEAGEPWFRQRIVAGRVNSVTDIEVIRTGQEVAEFRLTPMTGKKHQLRVHMESIGYPIMGDPFYPVIRSKEDLVIQMQLVARRLQFLDPLTGQRREFISNQKLNYRELTTGSS